MLNKRYRALIALNCALLCVLGLIVLVPGEAEAQQAGARPAGQYAIVAGRIQGRTADALYVLDASNRELMALSWDGSRRRYVVIGYNNFGRDQDRIDGVRNR